MKTSKLAYDGLVFQNYYQSVVLLFLTMGYMILYSDSESEMYSVDPSASWMRFTNYCTGCTSARLHAVNDGDNDLLLFKVEHVLTCIGDVPTPNPTLSLSNNSTLNSSIPVVSPKSSTIMSTQNLSSQPTKQPLIGSTKQPTITPTKVYNLYVYSLKSVLCMFSIIAPTYNPSQTIYVVIMKD